MINFENIGISNKKRCENGILAGTTSIICSGNDIVFEDFCGFSDVKKGTKINEASMFRLASMSKPITAIAVLQLIERGKIGLFDDISKYVPQMKDFNIGIVENDGSITVGPKARRGINIFQLLSHQSGLGQSTVGYTYINSDPAKFWPQSGDNLGDVFNRFSGYLLDCEPGTAFGYGAHIPYDLLGYIVELASGMRFSEYLEKNIFNPLEISDITFHPSIEQRKRLVKLYYSPKYDGSEGAFEEDVNTVTNFGGYPEDYEGGSCCLLGTCRDYSKIARMLLNDGMLYGARVLGEDYVKLMQTPLIRPTVLGYNNNEVWGLSVRVVTNASPDYPLFTGTFGWSGAYGTHFIVCPRENITALYFSNLSNGGGSGAPASIEFEQAVVKAVRAAK